MSCHRVAAIVNHHYWIRKITIGLLTAALMCAADVASAGTLIEDQQFTSATTSPFGYWKLSGDADFFTATQSDASSGKVVRLTPAVNSKSGLLVYDRPFSTSLGVQVDFDYYMGGGSGADGLMFFLVDGSTTTVTAGAPGGQLGYGTDYATIPGVPHGYFAVGFDFYGNGPNLLGNAAGDALRNPVGALIPNQIILAGSGHNLSGYRYLDGVFNANVGGGWRRVSILVRRGDGTNGCVSGGICLIVKHKVSGAGSWTDIYTDYRIDNLTGQEAIPATFKLGFVAGTGGLNNNHYVDNVQIYFDLVGHTISAAKAGSGTGTVTSTSNNSQATQLNCGTTCDVAYPDSTVVTLTATADSGSIFTGWSGGCSGTSAISSVTVSADTTCTATFVTGVTVSTSAGAHGSISPSSALIVPGTTAQFTLTPAAGYAVDAVSGCGGSLSGSTYTTGTVNSACTVTASFKVANDSVITTGKGGVGSVGYIALAVLALLALIKRFRSVAAVLFAVNIFFSAQESLAQASLHAGFGFGRALSKVDESTVTNDMTSRGIAGSANVSNTTRNAWRAFVGYDFNSNFAIEGGYAHLNEITTRFQGSGAFDAALLKEFIPLSGHGFEASAVGRLNFTETVKGFARVGAWRWKSEFDITGSDGSSLSISQTGVNMIGGFGVEFQPVATAPNWQVRIGWDRYDLPRTPADVGYIALVYYGQRGETQTTVSPATPAPAPAPVETREPVQEKRNIEQLVGKLEGIKFVAGKTEIDPVSYPTLDKIVNVLNEHAELKIQVEGHTDTSGNRDLNTQLSQHRAESVRKYLISKGIDGSRLSAKGFGPERPIADNGTPEGRAANRRVEFIIGE